MVPFCPTRLTRVVTDASAPALSNARTAAARPLAAARCSGAQPSAFRAFTSQPAPCNCRTTAAGDAAGACGLPAAT